MGVFRHSGSAEKCSELRTAMQDVCGLGYLWRETNGIFPVLVDDKSTGRGLGEYITQGKEKPKGRCFAGAVLLGLEGSSNYIFGPCPDIEIQTLKLTGTGLNIGTF